MNLQEIKNSISQGRKVFWKNNSYEVIRDNQNKYLICCNLNDHCIGLTHLDGVTLNGNENDFFLEPKEVLLSEEDSEGFWLEVAGENVFKSLLGREISPSKYCGNRFFYPDSDYSFEDMKMLTSELIKDGIEVVNCVCCFND